jgi:hypothetical protein
MDIFSPGASWTAAQDHSKLIIYSQHAFSVHLTLDVALIGYLPLICGIMGRCYVSSDLLDRVVLADDVQSAEISIGHHLFDARSAT